MKKIIKIIAFIIASIVCAYITQINQTIGIMGLTFLTLIFISNYFNKVIDKTNQNDIRDNLKYVKKGSKRYYNMYTWLGEHRSSDKIIYEFIGDRIDKPTTLENLRDIKQLLICNVGNDITDYYLIRNIIEESSNENFLTFFKSIFGKITIGTIIFSIVSAYLNKEEFEFSRNNLLLYISIGIVIFFIFLYFLVMIYNTLSKSKKRSKIILIVINEIIREKES